MNIRIKRLLACVGVGALGLLALAVLFRAASAEVSAAAPAPQAQDGTQDLSAELSLLWDRFDGTFAGTHDFARTIAATGSAPRRWGRVTSDAQGLADKLWCAQSGPGTPLTAGVDDYPNNMTTTLIYGPLNLNADAAELQFSRWISVAAGDGLAWGASTDGVNYVFTDVVPESMGQWFTQTEDLGNLLGEGVVYLAFRFDSDGTGVDKGVLLDDVRVRAQEYITASFFENATEICQGGSIYFVDDSSATSGIARREWSFGDGLTSTLPSVDHIYDRAGTYTVWLTVTSNLGAQDAVSKQVSVEYVDAVIAPSSGSSLCQYVPTTFTDAGLVTGTVAARLWTFDDGSTASGAAAVHAFQTAGTHAVTLAVTTTAGCKGIATAEYTVQEAPRPTIAASADHVDVGTRVYFTATSGVSWQWNLGDGTVTAPQAQPYVSHAYRYGGPKTVVLTSTAASGCYSATQRTIWVTDWIYLPLLYRYPEVNPEHYEDNFSNSSSGWPTWNKDEDGETHRGGYMIDRNAADLWAELILGRELADAMPYAAKKQILETAGPGITAGYPAVFYCVVRDNYDKVFISGPYKTKGSDFVYEVKARWNYMEKWHWGNAYGILVTREKVNPLNAKSVHGYSFEVRINPNSDGSSFSSAGWQLERWDRSNWSGGSTTLRGPHTTSYVKSTQGSWNTIRLEREGSALRVYVNDHLIAEATDNKYAEPLYLGFYAEHTGSSSTSLSYDVLFEWDDVVLDGLP
jgi:PKD repeat protein